MTKRVYDDTEIDILRTALREACSIGLRFTTHAHWPQMRLQALRDVADGTAHAAVIASLLPKEKP